MIHAIVLAPEAVQDFHVLEAFERSQVRDAMGRFLRHDPERVSRSRIKRLRGLRQPQYRLRVGELRVFYDVSGLRVEVLAIVSKSQAVQWLQEKGIPS